MKHADKYEPFTDFGVSPNTHNNTHLHIYLPIDTHIPTHIPTPPPHTPTCTHTHNMRQPQYRSDELIFRVLDTMHSVACSGSQEVWLPTAAGTKRIWCYRVTMQLKASSVLVEGVLLPDTTL